jgi:uncharacterized protein YbjT (DUF2867 family)
MTILVTGATGNVGRPLTELLVQHGAKVRAVSRNPRTADLPGAEVVATTELDGVTSIFLNPRAVGETIHDLLAQATGVRRVVALSAVNVDDNLDKQPSRYRGDRNKEVEDAVVASGLDWVSLRPTMFSTNTIGLWAAQIRAGDIVRGTYAEATTAPIHERDVAAVAAQALLTDDLLGRKIELTGPKSLTQAEQVAIIGETLGRDLRYLELAPKAAITRMVQNGFPEEFGEAYLALLATTVRRPAVVSNEVASILGRPALSFADWVTDHKEAFQR